MVSILRRVWAVSWLRHVFFFIPKHFVVGELKEELLNLPVDICVFALQLWWCLLSGRYAFGPCLPACTARRRAHRRQQLR